ncbi:MAG: nucleoside 2-deoxyribosyltransferase [Erysipelotrichaceae bacterium]|jgi:nucleoside 2-deoxyribosyltransferase|nr:nucleoside 2-deoxyribosyltransferase [Erysipelotrichaceae bacterium]
MIYIYNAGPLFTEAEVNQRLLEGKLLREILEKSGKEYFLANPLELPPRKEEGLLSAGIFAQDYAHIDKANAFFFELASEDSGTMVELGGAVEKFMQGKDIKIYPIFADIRLRNTFHEGTECPKGFNSYVVGALTYNNIPIYTSYKDALEAFKKDFDL